MDLSPNDIRNYEFPNQMRGYAREEVDNFLEHVAAALEALKQENLKLTTEVDSLKTQLAGLRQFEDTIKSAAIDARRNADLTIANAKKEAELILSKAKTEAAEIIGSRAQKVSELENQINKLQLAKKSYLSKLRILIKSHLEVLEEVVTGETPSDIKSVLEVTETTDVTREELETIATKPKKPEPIRTEEAKAAEQIAPAPTPPEKTETEPSYPVAEDTLGDRTEPPDKAVDPELAAALEKYQRKEEPPAQQQQPPTPIIDHLPAPGELVETTTRAEDIPEGFITPEIDEETKDDTDKVGLPVDSQPDTTEHNAIDVDKPADVSKSDSEIPPEKLAEELDRVVAKFEEEMDKAEKK